MLPRDFAGAAPTQQQVRVSRSARLREFGLTGEQSPNPAIDRGAHLGQSRTGNDLNRHIQELAHR